MFESAKPKKIQSLNQLTSISFGTDVTQYMSCNRSRERQVENAWGAVAPDAEKLRAQKQALQGSSFSLGDDRCDFSISSTLRDPTGNMRAFRGEMAIAEAKQLRKSHIELGTAKMRYQSTAQSQEVWARKSAWDENRKSVNKGDINMKERKTKARKVNFVLGDSATNYTSLMKATFEDPCSTRKKNLGWKPPANAKKFVEPSPEQTEVMLDDLRGAHFSLGTDRQAFVTSNQTMNSRILNARLTRTDDERELTHERKKSLVQTNLCLGDAPTMYVSTAKAQQLNHPAWGSSDAWEDSRGGRRGRKYSRSSNQSDR